MQKRVRFLSVVLILTLILSVCSCAKNNTPTDPEPAVTTEEIVETTAETTEPTPTPTSTPTPTPTPTPIPECSLEEVCDLFTDCVGESASYAESQLESFFGIELHDDVYETTNYEGKPDYIYNVVIIVEGVKFTQITIQAYEDEDRVEYIGIEYGGFASPSDTEEIYSTYYETYVDILNGIYGEPTEVVDQETIQDSIYVFDDDLAVNTGYYTDSGANFWFNIGYA